MSRLIAAVIAATVLAHALLGCCSHTVHFAAAASTSHYSTHDASHAHHHHDHDGAPPCEHGPSEDHDCPHDQCQWLTSTVGIDLEFASPFHCSSVVNDDNSIQLAAVVTQSLTVLAESPPPLPVRSHLALSVLLI